MATEQTRIPCLKTQGDFHGRHHFRMHHAHPRGMGHPEGKIRSLHPLCERRRDAALFRRVRHRFLHAEEGPADGKRLPQHYRVSALLVLEQPLEPGPPHHDDGGLCVLHDSYRGERRVREHRDQAAFPHQEPLRPRLSRLPAGQGRLDGHYLGRGSGRPVSRPDGAGPRGARHEQEDHRRRLRHVGRGFDGALGRLHRRFRQGLRTLDP